MSHLYGYHKAKARSIAARLQYATSNGRRESSGRFGSVVSKDTTSSGVSITAASLWRQLWLAEWATQKYSSHRRVTDGLDALFEEHYATKKGVDVQSLSAEDRKTIKAERSVEEEAEKARVAQRTEEDAAFKLASLNKRKAEKKKQNEEKKEKEQSDRAASAQSRAAEMRELERKKKEKKKDEEKVKEAKKRARAEERKAEKERLEAEEADAEAQQKKKEDSERSKQEDEQKRQESDAKLQLWVEQKKLRDEKEKNAKRGTRVRTPKILGNGEVYMQ
jgi:hypothetical protein